MNQQELLARYYRADWPDGVNVSCDLHPYTMEALHPPDDAGKHQVSVRMDGTNALVSFDWVESLDRDLRQLTALVQPPAQALPELGF